MTAGIYRIRNKKTGQIYIGQSFDIEKRFQKHCSLPQIDVAIALEGKDNFDFEIIEELSPSRDLLLEREQYWIRYYDADINHFHYNGGYDNATGFFRVSFNGDKYVRYQWTDSNGKRHCISGTSIKNLQQKVEERGLEWKKL